MTYLSIGAILSFWFEQRMRDAIITFHFINLFIISKLAFSSVFFPNQIYEIDRHSQFDRKDLAHTVGAKIQLNRNNSTNSD